MYTGISLCVSVRALMKRLYRMKENFFFRGIMYFVVPFLFLLMRKMNFRNLKVFVRSSATFLSKNMNLHEVSERVCAQAAEIKYTA